MIEKKYIADDLAPSYFLECLLYNVPDVEFGGNYQLSFDDCLTWLAASDLTGFACQNGVVPLFGTTEEQWDEAKARELIQELEFIREYWH